MKTTIQRIMDLTIVISFLSVQLAFAQKNPGVEHPEKAIEQPNFIQSGQKLQNISPNVVTVGSNGYWDSGLPRLNGYVRAIAVSVNDVYVGGDFTEAGGEPANHIAKWDESSWSPLGDGVNGIVSAIAVSGKDVYVGGDFTEAGDVPANYITKWDGSSWSPLGDGVNATVRAIAVSGKDVYVGGYFTMAGSISTNHIAKWDGNHWSPLSTGISGNVFSVVVSEDDVYVGGRFYTAGEVSACHIAKWDGSEWSALGGGLVWIRETGNTGVSLVNSVDVNGNDVFVGGVFNVAGDTSASGVAKWDGNSWSPLGIGLAWGEVNAISSYGNDVYVGGRFGVVAGYINAQNIAIWNGSGWASMKWSGYPYHPSYYNGVNNTVLDILACENIVYVGGQFNVAGGNSSFYIARWRPKFSKLNLVTSEPLCTDEGHSLGCAWGDYDNDGYLDLFVANNKGENNFLYANNADGTFTKITTGHVVTDGGSSYGSSWGDYNNDGYLDLFIVNNGEDNFLYRNNGDATFTKVTTGSVVTDGGTSYSACWGDYDNDGYLDLFVANYGENNFLYHNNRNGTFNKIINGDIVNDGGRSASASWADYDGDGDLDLFVANDGWSKNFLYQNNGDGSFKKITSGDMVNDYQDYSSGSWGDYDNDRDFDLFVDNCGENNFLYQNKGDGVFTSVNAGDMVTDKHHSKSSGWADIDNDGDLDLYVTNTEEDCYLYVNNSNETFTKYMSDFVNARGCSWADYDNDGDLDLFVAVYGDNNSLYRYSGNIGNNWLNIRCVGTVSNACGIGTKIMMKASIGGSSIWQMNEISSQTGFGGQNSLNAEFGLRDAEVVDSIRVKWPSGLVWDTTGVAVNQFLTIKEKVVINHPPVAADDSVTITLDSTVCIAVLSNDSDIDGDALTIQSVDTTGTSGKVVIDPGDTTVTYTPDLGFTGEDTFIYIVSDGKGGVDTALVTIEVINHPPVAADDSVTITQDSTVCIAVLSNDSDIDGDALTIQSVDTTGTSGKVVIDPGDTTVTYTPDLGFTGEDTFLYILTDGKGGLDTALVTVEVIQGTKVERVVTRPTEFRLYQNVPNPFNPTTTIHFDLPKTCFVTMKVFNLLGHEIETLIRGQREAGEHKIAWTAEGLSGGIYLYRLEAGEYVETKKMLLLK